jgi:2-polyprenyl-3-methyl-5-hydroxy-6-metoxy-1,4-benzoquinol methylase
MTATIDTITIAANADRSFKALHRTMWALGDYLAVATEVIPELGPELVAASRVRPGDSVLDVAAGTGNAAVAAALTGAQVALRPDSGTVRRRPGVRRPARRAGGVRRG